MICVGAVRTQQCVKCKALSATAPPHCIEHRGRALTHFYVGTINLAMFTADESFLWMLIHICMGGSLCACGLLMLFHHHCYQCRRKRHTNANMNGTAAVQNAHKALEVLREEAVEASLPLIVADVISVVCSRISRLCVGGRSSLRLVILGSYLACDLAGPRLHCGQPL